MAYYAWKSYKCSLDPFVLLEQLRGEPYSFLLESSLVQGAGAGRFSFLGSDPFEVHTISTAAQLGGLAACLDRYRIRPAAQPVPFMAGALGYIGYEAGAWFEPFPEAPGRDDTDIPPALFCCYNTVVAIDHWEQRVYVIAHGAPEKDTTRGRLLCERNMRKVQQALRRSEVPVRRRSPVPRAAGGTLLREDRGQEEFCRAVTRAKEYIARGDIYQVNLTQRFEGTSRSDSWSVYARLRELSPSAFGAFFDAGSFQVISSSPEGFLRLRRGVISTRPMKGTRSRGDGERQDAALREELLESDKDRAELTMIVDLLRNDLGKICQYGSVHVPVLRELETYATVYQTTATVQGLLRPSVRLPEILAACFPGGSITGCPKLRAGQIIAELETHRRSLYTGSLGYFSFCGNMDMNILIRTILKKSDRVYFGSGSGIVADSDPLKEYAETLTKARALREALGERCSDDSLSGREVCSL